MESLSKVSSLDTTPTKGTQERTFAVLGKVLVANRGEIAVRIMRTCREMGIQTVAVYSELDRQSLHARMADEAYALGGQTATESYLNTSAILDILEKSGADAVHPGYGFYAENADFAKAVADKGAVFIGPPPEAISAMGDKISARKAAERAGVASVPGLTQAIDKPEEIVAFANSHGWPVAIKAAYGGGGRGMRVINGPEEAEEAIASAAREAQASFGRPELYLERYLAWPRHIEVQVLADAHGNAVWLGERDCSLQRRHQKLIEETPAPLLSPDIRRAMGEAAVKVALACGYQNAGTVEFLYEDGSFYFLEMNTRLQVEHPITEMVTGIDLVEMQLLVASGEPLPFSQEDIEPVGHAIECRINAEDPRGGRFMPSPGSITRFEHAGGPWVRTDAGYAVGDSVSQYYDNLIAKLVVWGRDRSAAINRMRRALSETRIEGVHTSIPAQYLMISHPDFAEAKHSTRWVEERLDFSKLEEEVPSSMMPSPTETGTSTTVESSKLATREVTAEVDGRRYQVKLWFDEERDGVDPSPRAVSSTGSATGRGATPKGSTTRRHHVGITGSGSSTVSVPMQGTIVKLLVAVGDTVEIGQPVCVLEAMKMENTVNAEKDGIVREIRVSPGDTVGAGDVVAIIE